MLFLVQVTTDEQPPLSAKSHPLSTKSIDGDEKPSTTNDNTNSTQQQENNKQPEKQVASNESSGKHHCWSYFYLLT